MSCQVFFHLQALTHRYTALCHTPVRELCSFYAGATNQPFEQLLFPGRSQQPGWPLEPGEHLDPAGSFSRR